MKAFSHVDEVSERKDSYRACTTWIEGLFNPALWRFVPSNGWWVVGDWLWVNKEKPASEARRQSELPITHHPPPTTSLLRLENLRDTMVGTSEVELRLAVGGARHRAANLGLQRHELTAQLRF